MKKINLYFDKIGLKEKLNLFAQYNLVLNMFAKTNLSRTSIFLIFILCLFSIKGFGQGTNCATADPFCTGTTYNFPLATNNGTAEAGPDYTCLFTQPNPVWYYLLIDQPGSIDITIQSSPGAYDVDFSMWGPFSSINNCGNLTAANTIDCSYSTSYIEYANISNALTGQYYLLLITNYSNQVTDVTFSQTGGNGSTNCNIVYCNMTGLTAVPGACIPGNTYTESGSIVFNGAPATGTLTVTNSCGGTQTFNPPFTSPTAYSFAGLPSNGAGCSVTATFSAAPTCTMTTNYTAPPSCNACSVNAGVDQNVCGLTATLAATSGQAGYTGYHWDPVAGITFGNINSATSTITASASGTYTFTWYGTNSSSVTCTDIMTVTFNNPIAGFTYNNNQCLTGNSFSFTNTGSGPPATYSWTFAGGSPGTSTAQNPSGITFSTAGPHTVTQVVTIGGCTATYSQTITVYPQPTVNITPTNVTCNGACNGSAVATGAGGSGSYSYQWSTGSTSTTISSLCPNTYFVTVTDTYGCTGTNSVNITQPAALVLTPSRTDPTCNGACNGTANVVVAGGIGPFSYQWSNLGTTASITSLCAGTYTVTVTDNGSVGCTQTASVVLNNPAAIVLTSSSVSATCGVSNGSATVNITAGGVPNYNYQWSNGANTFGSSSTSNTNSSLSAGAYTVTVTNSNGCTNTTTVNVGSSGAPTATISSSTNPVCFGQCNGTATVSIGGTLNPPYNYVWSTGSSTMGTSAITNSVNNLCNGNSSVTITDNLGCSAVASVTVTQPSALNAITSTVSANCGSNNGSATITANGGTPGYSYLWNSAAGNQTTVTAVNLLPGTYSATVTDANLCTFVVSATVSNLSGVVASISGTTQPSCNGGNNGTATASGTGGNSPYTYQWPVSAGSQTTATATNLSQGTYTVTVTDANGCTSTANATVNQPTVVTATISGFTNALCNGACNGTANVTAAGGTSPYTYIWTNAQTVPGATGLCAGTYFVTVKDANLCSAVTSVTISQPTVLTVSTSTTNANCGQANGSATATPAGGTSPYSYLWSGGGQVTPVATNLSAGSYTVTVTDSKGCTAIANATVGNIAGGTASISSTVDVSCSGLCNGSATISMGGGSLPYTYLWPNGATTPNTTNLCAGSYTGTVTDAVGCSATATATINSPTPLTVSIFTNDVSCFGDCDGILTATPAGGTSPYTYSWSNFVTTAVNNNLCAGSYIVTVTDSKGCTATATGTISNIPPITLSTIITSANCNQSDGAIDLTVSNGSGPFSFNWLPSGNTEDLINLSAGVYNVTVTDIKGCTQSGSYTVPNISGPIASITSQTNVSCYGQSNGNAQGNVTGGTPSFTYAWSNGQGTQIATGLAEGVYTFSVTDGVGCVSTANVTITQPPLLSIMSLTSTNPLCNGDCNGTATVIATGGTSPLSYQWVGGTPFGGNNPTSTTTTGICSGSLSVLVTDANSCTTGGSTSVTEPAFISLNTSSTPETCNGLNDGTASVVATGGTTPYSYQWDSQSGGQSGSTAVGLAAGTYSVTVTDANNCTQFTSVSVTTPNPIVISSITPTHLTCWMSGNGSIGINVTGGTPNYSFIWTNSTGTYNSTSQNIGTLSAETYFVTITDQNGCSITTSQIISQPPQLSLNLVKTDETCYQFCNGTVNANVSGGQNPYTYLWSNLQGSQNIDSLCPGNYTVTVTDFNGCTITSTTTVTGNPLLQLSVTNITNATCGVSNGSATIGVQGGATGYTISWSTGGSALTENNMPAGNHTVTLIDSMGCTVVQQIAIQNLAGPQITALTPTPVSCAGMNDGVAIVSYSPSSPPAPPYISNWYSYNGGNTFTGDTISNLEGDLYYVTVTDANGCQSVGSIIVDEPTLFSSVPYGIVNNMCFGYCNGTASVLTGGGTQPYTWNWLGTGDTLSSATNLCAGQFTVVATDAHGCTSVNVINITAPTAISVSGQVTDVLCNGNSDGIISITPSGGTPIYQANWQPPASGSNNTIGNLPAGIFTVIVTDINNCTASASYTVNQPSPIYVYSSTTPTTCNLNNGTATIDSINGGTPGYTYIWSPGNATTPSISNLANGNYLINLTDNNGCQVTTNAFVTNIAPPSQITFIDTNAICNGTNTGSATANVVGGLAPYTFIWSDLQNTQTASALSAGIYTVTATDANGCTISNSTVINQPNPIIVFVSGSDSICLNSYAVNISVNASGGTSPYNYLWSGPGITNPTAQTQLVSPSASTNYYVNVTDANGCAASQQGVVPIYVYPAPSTNISNNATICEGNSYPIQAQASGGSGAPYNYYWNIGSGNTNVVSPIVTTTYTLYVTDACGASSDTVLMTVTVEQAPDIINPPNSKNGCIPLFANFSVIDSVASGNITYLWDFGDPLSGNLNTSTDSVTSHLYTTSGSFDVTLTLTSSFGCSSVNVYQGLVNAYPVPSAEFTFSPTVVEDPILNGDVQFFSQTETTNQISWTFGDGYTADAIFSPIHNYNVPGNYTIILFVKTNEGCVDTVQHSLHVKDIYQLWVPTAFYPGTGSASGYFYPKGVGFDKNNYYFAIYDRWGQIIFETREYPEGTDLTPNEVQDKASQTPGWIPGGWNGGYKNDEMKLVKVGTYTWYLRVKEIDGGELHEETGPVTVIR